MHPFRRLFVAAPVVLAVASAVAAPGDVVIPAHRAGDGTLIPANVPPSSGGTAMPIVAKGKVARRTARPVSRGKGATAPVPMFVEARPLRR